MNWSVGLSHSKLRILFSAFLAGGTFQCWTYFKEHSDIAPRWSLKLGQDTKKGQTDCSTFFNCCHPCSPALSKCNRRAVCLYWKLELPSQSGGKIRWGTLTCMCNIEVLRKTEGGATEPTACCTHRHKTSDLHPHQGFKNQGNTGTFLS